MPELPEVETVRRGLAPAMTGAAILRVTTRRADLRYPFPSRFAKRLEGARIGPLDRRGKYLLAPLSSGETLIMHLGMSGRFTLDPGGRMEPGGLLYAAPTDVAHDHVRFELDGPGGPARLVYNDVRRFGFMDLAATDSLGECRHFAGMGPEPLSPAFTPGRLFAGLKTRKAPIKAALLDQSLVAGLGNIYVCEALFRAGISPRRPAKSLSGARIERLHDAIIAVLKEAIAAGGSTLRDFAASDGARGYFQHRFSVYDRAGERCPRCKTLIRRFVQSGRSTFACGACQR